MSGLDIRWAGQELVLHPERALWWPAGSTLFVADLHLGKGDVFREGGIPIPSGTTQDDLDRLGRLTGEHAARRLVILGDFFHGRASQSPEVLRALQRWRDRCADTEVVLVRGNHDRHAGDPPAALRIRVGEAPQALGPFTLLHEPRERGEGPSTGLALAGHLHPVVRLEGPGGDRMRVPCFWLQPHLMVLPAFGGFTGGARIHPSSGDRVFVVGDESVLEAPLG